MDVNDHSYALSVLLPMNNLQSHWMASNVYAGPGKENNLRAYQGTNTGCPASSSATILIGL